LLKFKIASINDTDEIMNYIGSKWRKNHIMSSNKELFLYEFKDELVDRINFALALKKDKIVGIFGFLRYNYLDIPDLAGSFWMVDNNLNVAFAGLKLRILIA